MSPLKKRGDWRRNVSAIVSGIVTGDGNSPGSHCELTGSNFLLVS